MTFQAKKDWKYNTPVTETDINRWEKGIEDAHNIGESLARELAGSFVTAPGGTPGLTFTYDGLAVYWTAGAAYVNGVRFDFTSGYMTLNPDQAQYVYVDSDSVIKTTTSQAVADAKCLLWYFSTDANQVVVSIDKRKIISPDTFARKEEVVMKEPGKGLSTNDYSDTEKGKVQSHEERLTTVEEEIGEGTPFPVTLLPGLNIVTVPRDTPFNVLNLTGRTLINLLGRDGNCEDTSKWTPAPSNSLSLDNRYVVGAKGIFVSNPTNGQNAYFYKQITLDPNKYYYFSGYALSNLEVAFTIGTEVTTGTGGGIVRFYPNSDTVFMRGGFKFRPSQASMYLTCFVYGNTGVPGATAAVFDALSLYEISAAEYAALDSMTPEQIAEKYPYVDDVKGVRGAYIIRYGHNLLPPLTEWSFISANAKVTAPYTLSLTTAIANDWSWIDVNVVPNQAYTLSATTTGNIQVVELKDDGTYGATLVEVGVLSPATFTPTTKRIRVAMTNSVPGTFTFENPMLNIGSSPLPFEPQNDDYMIFDATFHGNPITGVADRLYFDENGQARKVKWFEEVVLDGSLPWVFHADNVGSKQVKIDNFFTNGYPISQIGVKYDGKIINSQATSITSADLIYHNPNDTNALKTFYISIADTDSGWGDAWIGDTQTKANNPKLTRDATASDLIKALFNGWKWVSDATYMWRSIYDSSIGSNDVDYVISNYSKPTHTPYRLLYQLAQPVEISVTSEGEISLFEGDNLLEVGTGIVRREVVVPQFNSYGSGYYEINNTNYPASLFKNRASKILSVYKGTGKDITWGYSSDSVAYGTERSWVKASDYDPASAYSVTYLVLDRYLYTAPLIDIQAEYRTKLAGVVAENSKDIADLSTRVSVVETQYARKQQRPWIAPVLLNGWVNFGTGWNPVGYFKDELGFVHLRGAIKSGSTAMDSIILVLPEGCRPANETIFPVITDAGSGNTIGRVDVTAAGNLLFKSGGNTYLALDSITFRAEQ
jgi:hypothetical protein